MESSCYPIPVVSSQSLNLEFLTKPLLTQTAKQSIVTIAKSRQNTLSQDEIRLEIERYQATIDECQAAIYKLQKRCQHPRLDVKHDNQTDFTVYSRCPDCFSRWSND